MPDDHSEVVPLLPIPNRTVKRFCANDSADSRVKVGHRQAITAPKRPVNRLGVLLCAAPFYLVACDACLPAIRSQTKRNNNEQPTKQNGNRSSRFYKSA